MICSLVLMSHYVSVKLPWINESKKRITNLVSKATEIKRSYYLCYYLTLLYLLYIICRCISDEYVFVGKASWLDLDPLILFLHRSGQSLISPDRNFFRSACGNSRLKCLWELLWTPRLFILILGQSVAVMSTWAVLLYLCETLDPICSMYWPSEEQHYA